MATVTGQYAGVQAIQTNNTAPWISPENMIDGNLGLGSTCDCVAGTTDAQRLGNAGLGINWTPWITITNVTIVVSASSVVA